MVVSLAMPKQVEWWDPAVIARDRLAIDRAGGSRAIASTISGKRLVRSLPGRL
jgi:hypothetical protein